MCFLFQLQTWIWCHDFSPHIFFLTKLLWLFFFCSLLTFAWLKVNFNTCWCFGIYMCVCVCWHNKIHLTRWWDYMFTIVIIFCAFSFLLSVKCETWVALQMKTSSSNHPTELSSGFLLFEVSAQFVTWYNVPFCCCCCLFFFLFFLF